MLPKTATPTATPLLFHGPGAEVACAEWAATVGRLVKSFGTTAGLKVDEAREVGELLQTAAIGEKTALVLIGLDRVNPKASDALLKVLEERKPHGPVPALWVTDLGSVSPTVRSRCQAVWAAGVERVDEKVLEAVITASQELLGGSPLGWVRLYQEFKESRQDTHTLLSAVAVAGSRGDIPPGVWDRVRPATFGKTTPLAILALVLGA